MATTDNELTKMLYETNVAVARIETDVKHVIEMQREVTRAHELAEIAKKIANEAHISARSAHKRIDRLDKWGFTILSFVVLAVLGALISLVVTS